MTNTNTSSIRIAIIDDHGIVRQGLRTLLTRPGFEVVAEGDSGMEAVNVAETVQPDVMLLDIRMNNGDGLQYLPEIRAKSPETSVIMLTTYANPGYLARAINHGAVGYLSKETEPEKIVEAIQAAANNNRLIDPTLLSKALQPAVDHSPPEPEPTSMPTEELSVRELDVLRLIATGMSNATIAETLNVSKATVKTHVKHILQKLNVSDRTQAALWAIREGIVQ